MFHTAMSDGDFGNRARSFVRVRAGRLVEVHVGRLAEVGEVAALQYEIREALRGVGPEPVLCADHRFASPLAGAVADACAHALRQTSCLAVRGALLLVEELLVHAAGVALGLK